MEHCPPPPSLPPNQMKPTQILPPLVFQMEPRTTLLIHQQDTNTLLNPSTILQPLHMPTLKTLTTVFHTPFASFFILHLHHPHHPHHPHPSIVLVVLHKVEEQVQLCNTFKSSDTFCSQYNSKGNSTECSVVKNDCQEYLRLSWLQNVTSAVRSTALLDYLLGSYPTPVTNQSTNRSLFKLETAIATFYTLHVIHSIDPCEEFVCAFYQTLNYRNF